MLVTVFILVFCMVDVSSCIRVVDANINIHIQLSLDAQCLLIARCSMYALCIIPSMAIVGSV